MGTIAKKLSYLNDTKTAIKNAIVNKGVAVADTDTFRSYADKINSISAGGSTPTPYVRPTDWLAIPTMDGTKDEIYLLNGVGLNCLNKIYFNISGSGTIDWGDGNTQSFSGANQQQFEHTFDYNAISESSYTTHNRTKQALIHITADRGAITYFSTANMTYKYTNADGVTRDYDGSISTDIYEINANVESCSVYCRAYSGQHHNNLEVFDWKGAITNTNMYLMFYDCYSLQTIPQLDTSNVTNMYHMFYDCYSLQSIPQLDTSKVTDMGGMFYGCCSLQTIPQLDTSKVTNMSYMFSDCYSLQSIPQLDTSEVTNMSHMFYYCYSLTNPKPYNAGAVSSTSINTSVPSLTFMTKQQLVDLFNSVAPNVDGHTRTLQLGSTLQGYLANCYVKDSGEIYTAILPTQDTAIQSGKTYYTYNDVSGEYTEFTGSTFESGTFYYELKTATWNRFDVCDSTDANAKLALTWFTGSDIASGEKGWTVS